MRSARVRCGLGAAVLTMGLGLAGCAGPAAVDRAAGGAGTVRTPAGGSLTPQAALDRIALGRSTKAEVAAALGPAIVLPFDSGYEVWLYRWRGPDPTPRSATELVVLFAPTGRATKVRVRPGHPPRP
ncbi:MAG: hypothetical protein ABIX46_00330 [Burkholderiaceae bacterium]